MTSKIIREILEKHLVPKQDYICGFADLTGIIDRQFRDFRFGISIGKSDLFVSKAFGPRLRLVSMLTNIPLDSDNQPIEKSRCGTCSICVQICPAKAINGKLWDITVRREEFFDPFKCRQKCKEFGEKFLKMDVRVCGICVSVCPVGT